MAENTNSIIGLIMGIISLVLSQCYAFPQLFHLCKTRNTSGISLTSYIIYICTSVLWSIWAIGFYYEQTHMFNPNISGNQWLFMASLLPAIILNLGDILLMAFILIFKIRSLIVCKQKQISELQLAKIECSKFKTNQITKYWPFIVSIICTILFILATILLSIYLTTFTNTVTPFAWLIVVNILASLTWEIFNWPQFIKSIKTKDTTGISLFWAIFVLVSCLVTFFYDLILLINNDGINWSVLPGMICNGIIPALGFLIIKIINLLKSKRQNLTEVEYIEKIKSH